MLIKIYIRPHYFKKAMIGDLVTNIPISTSVNETGGDRDHVVELTVDTKDIKLITESDPPCKGAKVGEYVLKEWK